MLVLPHEVTVAWLALTQLVLVRIQVRQPFYQLDADGDTLTRVKLVNQVNERALRPAAGELLSKRVPGELTLEVVRAAL